MVKRALTLLTSILIALHLLMPFNIFADESVNTAPFLGVNVQFTEVETEYTSMTMPILNFGYAGTQNTTGSVTGKMACSAFSAGECATWSLQNSNGNSVAGLSFTMNLANLKLTENGVWQFNKSYNYIVDYEFVLDGDYKGYVVLNGETTIYVNGRSFHHSIRQTGITEHTFTITDYQLTNANNPIMWNLPIESFSFVAQCFNNKLEQIGIDEYNNYKYPLFNVKNGDVILKFWATKTQTFKLILLIDKNIYNLETLNNYLSINIGQFANYKSIGHFRYNGQESYFISLDITNFSQDNTCTITSSSDFVLMPIYFNTASFKNISTDFALNWGLTNRFLDDINLIANGTVQSNSAASSNDIANEQLKTDSNTLFQQENGFKSDMQSAMQNVNNTFRLKDMGTKFVTSSQWVRTQYEQLTNNTPFASLITFSLITGLALILLGKVYR